MRILWVKAGKLLPVDTGGKIRSYNILRHLSRKHQVKLLSYYGGDRDLSYENSMGETLPGSHAIYTGAPEGTIRQSVDYVCNLASGVPYAVKKFTAPAVRQTVALGLAEKQFDVAVCDFLSASLNFPERSETPCILFQHNVEHVLWKRMAETESNPVRKLSYSIEASKMIRYEKATLRKFDHVIAVSQQDREEMLKLDSACRITVVPTGVDTEQYRPVSTACGDPPVIVFTGSMDWEANIDAMEHFCQQIWPTMLSTFPNARLQIVGRNPHARVLRLQSASVEVTGKVASVRDYLAPATVVIVPLRIGGGTRLKIFEAMAMGKAVVSTSIGAEGLDVTDGRDILIADSPEVFASRLVELLRNEGLRRAYENAAASLAARYDWSEISESFANVLQLSVQNSAANGRTN
ncbi:MAG TPA: glycosyltransferase family 4 protein [Candidatus Sulfotelmatobacter sp.]|nr:glycosyltransferase family 4 protein [Candidatus Sulfotelmatobacter sp.]